MPPLRPADDQHVQRLMENRVSTPIPTTDGQPLARTYQDVQPVAAQAEGTLASTRANFQSVASAEPLLSAERSAYPPVAQPLPQTVARPIAQPIVQPAARPAPQPAANPDDIFDGLEEAALRDIGDDIRPPRPVAADSRAATPEARPAADDSEVDGDKPKRRGRNRPGATEEKAAGNQTLTKTERQEMRADRLKRREEKGKKGKGAALPAPVTGRALDEQFDKPVRKRDKGTKLPTTAPREWGVPWTAISFLAMVLIPAAIASMYYIMIASPQYQVETQFAVRGSSQSSVATMGLGSLLGGTTSQTGDSYIVSSYVESLQLIRDAQQELGIDLREFYTRDHIDWLYRIDADMPLEKFTEYWRDMTEVSFNATTGNTTLYIYAFSAEDSKAIADAVLKVSERLVNQLSEENRQQVMQVASKQVDRAEERLRKVQTEIRKLRETEKTTDPQALVQVQTQLVSSLESQLSSLKTRMSALLKSVNTDAPQAKVLQKQIDALESQIVDQKSQLGTTAGDSKTLTDVDQANLSEVLNKFEELTIEQGFATQAYTTALAAFETAIVEAQRQERYFATFVSPTRPEIALYPMRYLDSFIAFLVLLAGWMATQFIYRSFRDHAV
jgi:capsular polysaccharide transport system permease protein